MDLLRKLTALLVTFGCSAPMAMADTLTITNTFAPSTRIESAKMNENFDDVEDWANGNITNANIKAAAAIAPSKLDLTATFGTIYTATNTTISLSCGVTGDTVPRLRLAPLGIYFGAGSASAVDLFLKRESAGVLAVRDGTDSGYAALKASTGTFSSTLSATGLTLSSTPLPVTSGGIGVATLTSGEILLGNGTSAVTSTAMLNVARGGTGAATFTANALLKGNGTSAIAAQALGTANQVFGMNSGATDHEYKTITAGTGIGVAHGANSITISNTGSGTSSSFGGNGSEGAISQTTATETTIKQRNSTTFSLGNAQTYTVLSGTTINATSTITIGGGASGTLTVTGGPSGGDASDSSRPGGPSPGMAYSMFDGTNWVATGGGGGGCAGNGGPGAAEATGVLSKDTIGLGGAPVPLGPGLTGSGGAAGMELDQGEADNGDGGAGGGLLRLVAVGAISVAAGAVINANGSDGEDDKNGGGGGSGGVILLASLASVTNSGTINATGGAGGDSSTAAAGGGGGGGGGYIVFWSPSNTAGSTAVTAGAGGAGGAGGGSGDAGGAGSVVSITGTPSYPLLVWLEDRQNVERLAALPSKNLKNRDVAWLAADGDPIRFAYYMQQIPICQK